MNRRKLLISALGARASITIFLFVIVLVLFTVTSYKDQRPVDRDLTIGYPFIFYTKTSGFNIEEGVNTYFEPINLLGNLVFYFLISRIVGFVVHDRSILPPLKKQKID